MRSPFYFEPETPPETGRCRAWIGLGQSCHEPPLPGRNVCRFHDSFAGPWLKLVGPEPKPAKRRGRPFWQRVREFLRPRA